MQLMNSPGKKKIIIIGPAHPLRGGIAAFNERLAAALMEEGHHVTILTFSFQYPGFLFPGKTQYSTDPEPAHLHIIPMVHSLNPFNWLRVANFIRKSPPDLLILRFWIPFMAPCLGSIARLVKKNRIRITGLLDNVIPHEKRTGDRLLISYFVSACDDFMAMSKQVCTELRQFSDKPLRYSPHPVYDQYGPAVERAAACHSLGLDPGNRYLLFFGLVRKYKGLDLLLEAFSRSSARKNGYKLIVAGEFYEDRNTYDQLIRTLQLEGDIIIHDRFIPDDEVGCYFGAADLVTQTYRSATQSGISQLAFHFEKPMLVTDVGGLGEIIRHRKSGLVSSPDPGSIASELDYFSSLEDKNSFLPAIREEKKSFSWSTFTKTLLEP